VHFGCSAHLLRFARRFDSSGQQLSVSQEVRAEDRSMCEPKQEMGVSLSGSHGKPVVAPPAKLATNGSKRKHSKKSIELPQFG
jgi:hypothetical protein